MMTTEELITSLNKVGEKLQIDDYIAARLKLRDIIAKVEANGVTN